MSSIPQFKQQTKQEINRQHHDENTVHRLRTFASDQAIPLLEAHRDATMVLAQDSLIVLWANEAMARSLGASIGEIEGRSALQWIDESQRIDFSRAVRMAGRHPLVEPVPFLWCNRDSKAPLVLFTTTWSFRLSSQAPMIGLSARFSRGKIDALESS